MILIDYSSSEMNTDRSALIKSAKVIVAALTMESLFIASSYAGEKEDQIFSLASAIRTRYLADNGDIKKAVLVIEDNLGSIAGNRNYCTPRRVNDLAISYRNLLNAVAKQDVPEIMNWSTHLHHNASGARSSMFKTCWDHMVRQASAMGDVAEFAQKVVEIQKQAQ